MTLAHGEAAGTSVAAVNGPEGVDAAHTRAEAGSDTGEPSRWMPGMRALTIAALLGAVAGAMAAFWVTVAKGLGL